MYEVNSKQYNYFEQKNLNKDSRERERERVINNNVGLKPTLIMLFALLVVVGTILYIGFQNSANAAPEQVNFNGVTLRDGAKVYANGGQSLTAINSGAYLVADTSSTTSVKGDAIANSLTSYTSSTYGTDTLFKTNTASNVKSLSEAQLNSFRSYLPTVDNEYWLSNTGERGSITWQSYALRDNKLTNNTLKATGKVDNFEYDNTTVVKGTYAYNKDLTMNDYVIASGATYDLSLTGTQSFRVYYTGYLQPWFGNGAMVYNNPYCYSSGTDNNGNPYRSSVIANPQPELGHKVLGYVSSGNRVTQVRPGESFPPGTVMCMGFIKSYNEIADPAGFLIPSSNTWSGSSSSASYIGFIKATASVLILSRSADTQTLYGFGKYYDSPTTINGQNITSATKAVRPVYDSASDNMAFTRTSTAGSSLTTTTRFDYLPTSTVLGSDSTKLVIKSSETTISEAFSASNLSTNTTAKGHGALSYEAGVIKVPYGSKSLTINSGAFTTANANYISALANSETGKKYAVLGGAGSNLTLDLTTIMNVNQVGNKVDVSFYSEQANASQTSDAVSATPVCVQIEIVEGESQTIKYTNGDGTGTPPSSTTVRSGRAYSMAFGNGLFKDGSPFARWKVTYTPFGETTEVSRSVKGGEMMIVPETANGVITATAIYAGVTAKKWTDSTGSVITVTWDANAPNGTTAAFTGDGTFNDAMTQRFDKIKLAGSSVVVPSAPTLSAINWVFDGWYTDKTNGTKIDDPSVSPTSNTTYYAHWLAAYVVTYDATGGGGLVEPSIAGKFNNGDTAVKEAVVPGNSLKGPNLGGSIAEPVPSDSTITGYSFLGWYTQPNGAGTKAELGSTKPDKDITYFAYIIKGYKITYEVTGGTGATQTGKWSDGTSTKVEEIVSPGASSVGPGKGIPVANSSSYIFYGWYTQPNGIGTEIKTGTSFASLGGSKTAFAYYGIANTFLAPKTNTVTANPRNISGDKYSIALVKTAATDIASNGTSSSYYSQYQTWMKDDSYHLYTLLNSRDASQTDSWVEFRIVNVDQHDSDGTGLTFQAVHMLPTAYQMNSSLSNSGGWALSALRTKMQSGGVIYNMFDTQLTSRVYNVTQRSKGKLWLPSYSEMSGATQVFLLWDGSQFNYWRNCGVGVNGSSSILMLGTRSRGTVASIDYSNYCWWLRSPLDAPEYAGRFEVVQDSRFAVTVSGNANNYYGVVPCFSL